MVPHLPLYQHGPLDIMVTHPEPSVRLCFSLSDNSLYLVISLVHLQWIVSLFLALRISDSNTFLPSWPVCQPFLIVFSALHSSLPAVSGILSYPGLTPGSIVNSDHSQTLNFWMNKLYKTDICSIASTSSWLLLGLRLILLTFLTILAVTTAWNLSHHQFSWPHPALLTTTTLLLSWNMKSKWCKISPYILSLFLFK